MPPLQRDPTPLAVTDSLLDVLQPALEHGEDDDENRVLSHFLLDGDHKIEAGARDE